MASESTVQRQIWAALARVSKLFRTNSGKGWISGGGPAKRLPDGTVLVPNGRPVGLGLAMVNGDTVPGLSDLTGYTPTVVTSDMVGRTLPVFTCIECKRSKGGRKADNQVDFLSQVIRDGGIAGFAASPEEALEIVAAWRRGDPLA